MIVIGDGTAPRRVGRRESRDTVPVTKVTVIDADPLFDDATAADWLRGVSALPDFGPPVLARLVASFRVASGDPFLADFDVARAWRTRVGYGSGDQVAEGEWADARELAPPAESRHERRSKQRQTDRFVALLSARDATLACEELTSRARLDLTLGRHREAALQLEAALTAACAELAGWRTQGDMAERLAELETYLVAVAPAATAARQGTLDAAGLDTVSAALERLEAALRARAIYSAEGD